jgi:hypothetical protein
MLQSGSKTARVKLNWVISQATAVYRGDLTVSLSDSFYHQGNFHLPADNRSRYRY